MEGCACGILNTKSPGPDNRAIQCYLWCDWFHDSAIKRFDFQEADLIITVQCCRDMDAFFDRHKSWSHERCREYIHSHLEAFTYHLRFTRLAYFRTDFAHELNDNDYINGRFKQSAMLRRLQAQNPKARYHLLHSNRQRLYGHRISGLSDTKGTRTGSVLSRGSSWRGALHRGAAEICLCRNGGSGRRRF